MRSRTKTDAVVLGGRLSIDTVSVFGHSFGGGVAQELALRHPDRVSALILAAQAPRPGLGERHGAAAGPRERGNWRDRS